MQRCRNHLGFSLVELSIVLVILGLLIGGVLSGQALIRAAELRSVTAEYQKYIAAINSFRDKYFGLPGDIANGASFGWTDAAGVAVANGDGNGQINYTSVSTTNEVSSFWVELAKAGLIEGSYTLFSDAFGTMPPGTSNPRAKMNNGNWNSLGIGTVDVTGMPSYTAGGSYCSYCFYAGTYGNVLYFNPSDNALAVGGNGILKSEEAWNIDTKMDDGKPDRGSVTTLKRQGSSTAGYGCGNISSSTSAMAPSSYDLANNSQAACSLVFKTGY